MADYTRLTSKEIKHLITPYELGNLESLSPMKGGQANSSFRLAAGKGQFILSICDEKDQQEIDSLTQVLDYLEIKNIPTHRLVKTRDQRSYVLFNDKPVYIKKFIGGKVNQHLSFGMIKQVGGLMADLHAIPALDIMPDQYPNGSQCFDDVINTPMRHPYLNWLKKKQKYINEAMDTSMGRGFIHGDIFWDNLLVDDDKVVAIIDFEDSCHYYKLFDIGMCAVGCCRRIDTLDMEKASCLLQGYQVKSRLTTMEKKQLKVFMEYAAVSASLWRFRQYNIKYPDKEKAGSYEELSLFADAIHTMAETDFLRLFTPI